MFCNKCGCQLADDSKWCSSCGAAVGGNVTQENTGAPQTHNIPKCTCCGHVGEMQPGPLLRKSDILWILLLFVTFFGGFVYLAYILMLRADPKKREKICPKCKSQNMYTYVY